ncbi:MAG TPA: hypothetical protein VG845_00250, partial [Dehalococcoidia bacterium]|nr:hypothetical protein [Dehalococcoidia bacterium]
MVRHHLWRLAGFIVLMLIAVSSLSGRAPERAQASVFDWAPVGDIVMIDVPGAVNVIDLNPFRPGKQTFVIALHNQETGA